jgi:MFS family permease
MQMTAQSFLVFELTRSPAYLGYVSFTYGIPSWLLMLYGGVIADRFSRRKLLLMAQSCMMLLACILATLTFTGLVQPWHIILLALGLGTANAFDAPARQAFVFELVERKDITNAVALNSTLFNLSAVVGPAVAGVVYMFMGPAWCFTVNAVSFLAVIYALLRMNLKPQAVPAPTLSTLVLLREGLRYVARDPVILPIMCQVAITALFGFAFVTLMPAWAVTILGGDATTNGLLQSARGAGAVLSALMIAALGGFRFRGRLLTIGSFVLPVSLFIFALVRQLPLSLLVMVWVGISLVLVMNLANALIQTSVSDHVRGRVMSIYTLTHFGFMPIGGLLAGTVAEHTNEPATVIVTALVCLASSMLIWILVPRLRALE